jgi:hypothetical protein
MICRVALVRTDVSEELSASFIRVTRIGELETTLAVTSNRRTLWRNTKVLVLVFLRSVHQLLVTASVVPSSTILVTLPKEALSSSETSVLTRATWRSIPEDTILPTNFDVTQISGQTGVSFSDYCYYILVKNVLHILYPYSSVYITSKFIIVPMFWHANSTPCVTSWYVHVHLYQISHA